MQKEFVPYDLAVKLKELGFNERCFGYYLEDGTRVPASYSKEGTVYPSNTDLSPEWSAAPLYSQAFRFFREKKYQSEILWRGDFGDFCWKIGRFKYGSHFFSDDGFSTCEEAELACLQKLIEIVKTK